VGSVFLGKLFDIWVAAKDVSPFSNCLANAWLMVSTLSCEYAIELPSTGHLERQPICFGILGLCGGMLMFLQPRAFFPLAPWNGSSTIFAIIL